MYIDNIGYAEDRLLNTIVRYGGIPILIRRIFFGPKDNQIMFTGKTYDSELTGYVGDLDIEPIPLGYVNYNGHAYYMIRKPMRNDWRQGLRPGNFTFVGREGFFEIPLEEITNTCLGKYPSLIEACQLLKNKKTDKVAITRHFAVCDKNKFYYKEKVVGSYDKLITLSEPFKYLSELLAETVYANA